MPPTPFPRNRRESCRATLNTAITTHSQGNRLKSMNDKITIPAKPRAMPMHWTITARWELTFA